MACEFCGSTDHAWCTAKLPGKPGPSPQTDEGAASMRTIYGRDLAGVWHATTATYRGAIDTVCGQRGLAAALFSTDPRQHDTIRPEFCDACTGRAGRTP